MNSVVRYMIENPNRTIYIITPNEAATRRVWDAVRLQAGRSRTESTWSPHRVRVRGGSFVMIKSMHMVLTGDFRGYGTPDVLLFHEEVDREDKNIEKELWPYLYPKYDSNMIKGVYRE